MNLRDLGRDFLLSLFSQPIDPKSNDPKLVNSKTSCKAEGKKKWFEIY